MHCILSIRFIQSMQIVQSVQLKFVHTVRLSCNLPRRVFNSSQVQLLYGHAIMSKRKPHGGDVKSLLKTGVSKLYVLYACVRRQQ